jgi:hypothetical protein
LSNKVARALSVDLFELQADEEKEYGAAEQKSQQFFASVMGNKLHQQSPQHATKVAAARPRIVQRPPPPPVTQTKSFRPSGASDHALRGKVTVKQSLQVVGCLSGTCIMGAGSSTAGHVNTSQQARGGICEFLCSASCLQVRDQLQGPLKTAAGELAKEDGKELSAQPSPAKVAAAVEAAMHTMFGEH